MQAIQDLSWRPPVAAEGSGPGRRRHFTRDMSRVADATLSQALAFAAPPVERPAWRIGITGPPGAGKSSIVARLASVRLGHLPPLRDGEATERLAVLAIDPSSPVHGGAILGDRVRMDAIAGDPRIYIRSLASRGGLEGLAHNIVDILRLADIYGFQETLLETVGVGQAEHAVRALVDTLILVLHPDAGDTIQAMKSGLMEVCDIYVVNKADLPGARRMATELRAVLKAAPIGETAWTPPIIELSQADASSIERLDQVIEAHRAYAKAHRDPDTVRRSRDLYHLKSLLWRHLDEVLGSHSNLCADGDIATSFAKLRARL
jgi:GTPase